MRVSLAKSERSFSVEPGEPVLAAALRAGVNLPHGCKGGNCGACRAHLLRGEIVYPAGRPLGLSDAEMNEGFILLCQARASADLLIDAFERQTPEAAISRRLPCRIERVERWSHDVAGVFLRLPSAEAFHFEPGQYVDILLSGGRRRSFSIASPPHDARPLELHIRRASGGAFTEQFFAADLRSALLSIEGPLGRFAYRPNQASMLLVGGGTGLAPLKSILRHVMERDPGRDMTLYWGVRDERDLYAHRELDALARRAANFRYHAVLSEPHPNWPGRRGWVHDAVLQDVARLQDMDIYASGPPAMITALRRDFAVHGVDQARLYFDSFDYAQDTVERQRTTADTKS